MRILFVRHGEREANLLGVFSNPVGSTSSMQAVVKSALIRWKPRTSIWLC